MLDIPVTDEMIRLVRNQLANGTIPEHEFSMDHHDCGSCACLLGHIARNESKRTGVPKTWQHFNFGDDARSHAMSRLFYSYPQETNRRLAIVAVDRFLNGKANPWANPRDGKDFANESYR